MTAFFKYLISRKADMKHLKCTEMAKAIGEEWRKLSPEEKLKWSSMPEGQNHAPVEKLNDGTLQEVNTNDTTATGTSQQVSPQPLEHNPITQNSPNNDGEEAGEEMEEDYQSN